MKNRILSVCGALAPILYMLFVAFGLSLIFISQSLGFSFTREVPAIVTNTGRPTNIVFALDLPLLLPFLVLGAIWLIKLKPWGYVLTGIVTIKGSLVYWRC
jgi:hypothetical protein